MTQVPGAQVSRRELARRPGSCEPARAWPGGDGMAGMFGFKIIRQYERGVLFRWGGALPGIREPGLTWVNPFTDRLRK